MTSATEKWTPITELPNGMEADANTPLIWDFELPPTVDAERIVLNTRMLGRIQAIAAFRSTHVTSYQGETTQYTPGIKGVNPDGSAQAAMTGQVKKAPSTKTHIHDELPSGPLSEHLMRNFFRTDTINSLNRAELASVVSDGKDSGKSREFRWAAAIDDALSRSLRESAKQHLMDRQIRGKSIADGLFYSVNAMYLMDGIINHDPQPSAFTFGIASTFTALQIDAAKFHTGDLLLKERRWSLAYYGDMQPDRYALASAITQVCTLVQTR